MVLNLWTCRLFWFIFCEFQHVLCVSKLFVNEMPCAPELKIVGIKSSNLDRMWPRYLFINLTSSYNLQTKCHHPQTSRQEWARGRPHYRHVINGFFSREGRKILQFSMCFRRRFWGKIPQLNMIARQWGQSISNLYVPPIHFNKHRRLLLNQSKSREGLPLYSKILQVNFDLWCPKFGNEHSMWQAGPSDIRDIQWYGWYVWVMRGTRIAKM